MPPTVTETYDLDLQQIGVFCSFDHGTSQTEHCCLWAPGLPGTGSWTAPR